MTSLSSAMQQLFDSLGAYGVPAPAAVPGDGSSGEIQNDPEAIENLKRTLETQATDLDGADLRYVTLSGSEFGGSGLGLSLGDHHGRARRVTVETILGVVADLNRYRDGVVEADRLLNQADTDSAADMDRTRARAEGEAASTINEATSFSEADEAYDEARNSEANESRAPGHADQAEAPDAPSGAAPAVGPPAGGAG